MTTEEKARAYADRYEAKPMAETAIRAYIAGHFEALASQWKDPKLELPEIPDGKKLIRVLAWVGDEPLVCWYTCHGRFITTLAAKERYSYDSLKDVKIHLSSEREDVTEIVTHWLPIPPLKGGDV